MLPTNVKVIAVGHIGIAEIDEFWQAGAGGFGIGSGMYRPGDSPEDVGKKARSYVTRMKQLETNDG